MGLLNNFNHKKVTTADCKMIILMIVDLILGPKESGTRQLNKELKRIPPMYYDFCKISRNYVWTSNIINFGINRKKFRKSLGMFIVHKLSIS